MASKRDLLNRAEILMRLAKQAAPADPELAASFVQRAADLKDEADSLEQLAAPEVKAPLPFAGGSGEALI